MFEWVQNHLRPCLHKGEHFICSTQRDYFDIYLNKNIILRIIFFFALVCSIKKYLFSIIAIKYKTQTSRQSPHLIRLFLWLIKYWYILNKITFRNLPEKKSLLLKKLNKHCIKPLYTCSGGHEWHCTELRSHELLLSSQNYGSAPIITMLAHNPSLGRGSVLLYE